MVLVVHLNIIPKISIIMQIIGIYISYTPKNFLSIFTSSKFLIFSAISNNVLIIKNGVHLTAKIVRQSVPKKISIKGNDFFFCFI